MTIINMSLVCDGSSDTCVQDIVQWLMDSNFPDVTFRMVVAKEVIPAHAPLDKRLLRTYNLYQPDLILCHRDAEANGHNDRLTEIYRAVETSGIPIFVVPVVPVRMIESWLLADEQAIRSAADNHNGTVPLELPKKSKIESLANPKAVLFEILRVASDLPTQRLRRFNEHHARSRISSFMQTFESLRSQQSFTAFENSFLSTIQVIILNHGR